jgi:hypothetical protein
VQLLGLHFSLYQQLQQWQKQLHLLVYFSLYQQLQHWQKQLHLLVYLF